MGYRSDKQEVDTQTHTHTDTGDDNTRRPKGPRVKGVTDRRTDGRTDGQTENTICRAAWSQLKTIGHLFYATSSFVHHFIPIGELRLQSGNAQFGSKSTIFLAV